jgi:ParB-like chromosome segregation protein Spo0J
MNTGGVRYAFEEGRLIETLHREFQWTLREIGKKLLKSKSWVSRRLSLVEEMPEWLTEAMVEGRIGVNAAVVYVGPLWRHNSSEAKALVEKIQTLELSDRQMRELLVCYRKALPEVKKKIAEDPALYLKARHAAQATAELSDAESRCVKNLTIVGNICVGLVKSLPEALPTESVGPVREMIHKAWADCHEKYRWLEKTAATVLGRPRAG